MSRLLDGLAEPVGAAFARIESDAAVDGASPHPTVEDAAQALEAALAALAGPLETYRRAWEAAAAPDRARHDARREALLAAGDRAAAAHAAFVAHVAQKRDVVRDRITDLGRAAQGMQAYAAAQATAVASAYGIHAVRSSPR